MSSSNKVINKNKLQAPKNLTPSYLIDFINESEIIFFLIRQHKVGFIFDFTKVKQASILGVLCTYKIIEFAAFNYCTTHGQITISSEMDDAFRKFGFTKLINTFLRNPIIEPQRVEKEYKNLEVSIGANFIIAPQALLRHDKSIQSSLNKIYLPKIDEYYKSNEKAVSMIFLVFSEVLLNFWEHAVSDTKSIIVANGNKQNIEIACADTGNGIIETLGKSLFEQDLKPEEVLQLAVKKGVTSKRMTNHMGYGLWILDEIVTRTKGRMHIYSQGAYYINEYGKKKSGSCGYWQGSIVYISLPLLNPITLSDIQPEEINNDLQINWT
ncbi:hypothetical protein [Pontibacter populi]|uniref:ATP-binding protein n=1 Tax=Pontibacter populi TaxID=890055 RepID=A0ABV1RQ07_9BACT